jgi:hypothetical protein
MKRALKMIIFTLICGLVFTLTECEKNDNLEIEDNGKVTVSLLESDDYVIFEKTMILLENENYLIKTPLFLFLGGMNNLFGLDYDKFLSIIKKIISDGQANDLLYTSSYFDTYQMDYLLANFLENGFCYFYDKNHESNIKQVVFEYRRNSVSLAGERKFHIDNVLFLETVDSFIGYKEANPFIGSKGQTIEKGINVIPMKRDDYVIFKKTVILYEDENYLIKTPLSYFLSNMGKDYFVHRYDEHLSTLEKVISDGQANNLLYSSPYFTNPNYRDNVNEERIKFVLAGFLESGDCYIYDKKKKKNITQIEVKYWGYSPAPPAGSGGRKFYINNVLFIETTDWTS